jgi:hypothetical protein
VRIEQSNIALSSTHQVARSVEKKEDLQVWDSRGTEQASGDQVSLSITGKTFTLSLSGDDGKEITFTLDKKYLIIARLLADLTGKEITVYGGRGMTGKAGGTGNVPQAGGNQASQTEGWGLRYDSVETYTEREQTTFAAQGVVTADGKEYSFSASLAMDRSYSTSQSVSIRAGDALKDPLVLNLGQGPAVLSGQKMSFDIDMDGTTEDVPTLGGGSGFLSIDKNQNGVVDNGSELFGPTTGNGFSELASYDEDGNGWIDEGDSVYSRLGIWTQNGESQTIQSLKELNIGAIYTSGVGTPFEMKNGQNETEAAIRQTGIYLRENGSVGTAQQLDLAV